MVRDFYIVLISEKNELTPLIIHIHNNSQSEASSTFDFKFLCLIYRIITIGTMTNVVTIPMKGIENGSEIGRLISIPPA